MAVIFNKNMPQRCEIEMKNEVKTFYFGDYIRTWSYDLQKKKEKKKRSSPCFPISVRPAASTIFPNLALCLKSLPTSGLAYFSHLALLVLFFFTKRPSQKGGGGSVAKI